jgi:hypothetical protein
MRRQADHWIGERRHFLCAQQLILHRADFVERRPQLRIALRKRLVGAGRAGIADDQPLLLLDDPEIRLDDAFRAGNFA